MSDKVMTQVFKAFWKFTFINTENETMQKNLVVNHRTLRAMLNERYEVICDFVKDNPTYFFVAQDDERLLAVCALLARFPRLYPLLDEAVKYQIINHKKDGVEITKWFIEGDLEKHIENLKNNKVKLKDSPARFLSKICEEQGQLHLFNDLVIDYYSNSSMFTEARDRFTFYIKPYLDKFSAQNFIDLIVSINNNPQIYNYINQQGNNDILLEYAQKLLPADFDYDQYPHFEYTVVEESGSTEESEENSTVNDELTD